MFVEMDTLNNINRSLAETVDLFRADENNGNENVVRMKAEIEDLKKQVASLQDRVQRLNKVNFDVRSTNDRLKSCLDTHAKKVMSEHNYHM